MTLTELAEAYSFAKQMEEQAIARRRELAAAILEATGHDAEGQKTYTADDWKITVKAPLIRSMDWKQWASVKDQIHPDLHPIKIKEELDEKGVRWLADNDPHAWAILAPCLTTKPGAIQISVKPAGEEG